MRFIDLFAGLGGFHQALESLGHECVFASELNSDLADLYSRNFGVKPHGEAQHNSAYVLMFEFDRTTVSSRIFQQSLKRSIVL